MFPKTPNIYLKRGVNKEEKVVDLTNGNQTNDNIDFENYGKFPQYGRYGRSFILVKQFVF